MNRTLKSLLVTPLIALTLLLTSSVAMAQGTASGPFTIHVVDPGPVVNIGSLINPFPIDLDPVGPPWFKNVGDPNFLVTGASDLAFNETIINVGTEPWYDWHELILSPPVGMPQSNWLTVKVLVNGTPIGFSSTGLGTPALDLFGFSQPVLPGDILQIQKTVEVFSTAGFSGAFLRIQEYPTPEPASLALLSLGSLAVLRRRKEAL
ncbi:MAG: PEP-CTERM sorting domain-containing protein [Phycisphaerales bacterium]